MGKDNAKKITKIAVFYYLPLLFWMGLIFYLSSLEGSPGAHYNLRIFIERKIAHVVEYFILTLLIFRVLNIYIKNKKEILGWSFLFSFVYAVSDEIHQIFVPQRDGKITDIGFDVLGILLAILLIYFILEKRKNSKKSKKK